MNVLKLGLEIVAVARDGMAMALSCDSSAGVSRVYGLAVTGAVGVDQAKGVE